MALQITSNLPAGKIGSRRSLLVRAAGLALAAVATPAKAISFMTLYPNSSSSDGHLFGAFQSSGVSQLFQPNPGVGLSVRVGFGATATGTITLTRSFDGGQTWTPFTLSNGAPISFRTSSGKILVVPLSDGALYRLECSMSAGVIDFDASVSNMQLESRLLSNGRAVWVSDLAPMGGRPDTGVLPGLTAGQMTRLYDARFTTLSDADLSGDLTLYKTCTGNNFAKVVVPAAAQRQRGPQYLVGMNREIRAEYVNVISTFDGNGMAIASATSTIDPQTTYVPGNQVQSRDIYGNNTGTFMSETNWTGIYGYPTLIEAAAGHLANPGPGVIMPNPTALGL